MVGGDHRACRKNRHGHGVCWTSTGVYVAKPNEEKLLSGKIREETQQTQEVKTATKVKNKLKCKIDEMLKVKKKGSFILFMHADHTTDLFASPLVFRVPLETWLWPTAAKKGGSVVK